MRIFCIDVLIVSCVEELNDALSRIKSPSDVTVVEKGLVSLLNVIDNEGKAGSSNLQCFVALTVDILYLFVNSISIYKLYIKFV